MALSVVETWLALIPTELLIIQQSCRQPRAFPSGKFLAPLMIHALEATLSVKSRRDGNGSCLCGCWRYAAVAAT